MRAVSLMALCRKSILFLASIYMSILTRIKREKRQFASTACLSLAGQQYRQHPPATAGGTDLSSFNVVCLSSVK
jgi:hypothetical protein